MDRRAFQTLRSTITSIGYDVSTLGDGLSSTICPTATTTNGTVCHAAAAASSSSDLSAADFASTALWTVVVATLSTAAFMGGVLIYTRRRKRMRTRQQIRALLWDVVRGVQDGTIEPVVLQKLVYGPDGINAYLRPPRLFEACLPSVFRPSEGTKEELGNDAKWLNVYPLSLTPPSSSQNVKDVVSSSSLLQWTWRQLHSLGPPSTPDPAVQGLDTEDHLTSKGKEPLKLYAERRVDAGVLIAMPRASSSHNVTSTPPLLINCPVGLGLASLTFQDNLLDPVVPMDSRAPSLSASRVVDPLSSLLARHTQGRSGLYVSNVNLS